MSSFTKGRWEWSHDRTRLYTENVLILETKLENDERRRAIDSRCT